jgi:haloacetate dehalogenase
LPEMLLGGQAEPFLRNFAFRGLIPDALDEAVFAEYLRCFANPQTLHAMCEDYRAGASIDLQHDETDLATLLPCPTLILWGVHGAMHRLFDVLETWRPRAPGAQGKALPAGHWLPEECPEELAAALLEFLA